MFQLASDCMRSFYGLQNQHYELLLAVSECTNVSWDLNPSEPETAMLTLASCFMLTFTLMRPVIGKEALSGSKTELNSQ